MMVINLPLLLCALLTRKRTARYVFAVCIGLAVLSLIMAGTRAAFLGCAVSLGLFAVLTYGTTSRKRYVWVVSLALFLAVGGFIAVLKAPSRAVGGLGLRQLWWQTAVAITEDHPVMGTGAGTFNVYYPSYRRKSAEASWGERRQEVRVMHAHNEFLQLLSELGVVGFLLFLGILLAFFRQFYRHWNPQRKYVFAALCCGVVGILVQGLFSVSLRYSPVTMFFWLYLALPAALMAEPGTEAKATLSAGRIGASMLLAPLLAMVFVNYSLRMFIGDTIYLEGLGYFERERYSRALPLFKSTLEHRPQEKLARYYLGVSQFRLNRYPESRNTFMELVEIDPHFLQTHYWLGNAYLNTGDLIKAKQEYQETLRLNDPYGPAYYALGILAIQDQNIPQALDHLELAYVLEGDRSTRNSRVLALERLIDVHKQLGNLELASSYAEKLRELKMKLTNP